MYYISSASCVDESGAKRTLFPGAFHPPPCSSCFPPAPPASTFSFISTTWLTSGTLSKVWLVCFCFSTTHLNKGNQQFLLEFLHLDIKGIKVLHTSEITFTLNYMWFMSRVADKSLNLRHVRALGQYCDSNTWLL